MSKESFGAPRQDKAETAQTLRKTYVYGFVLSLALTGFAYLLVRQGAYTRDVLLSLIVGLALVQFMVQLVCFLHLSFSKRSPWKIFAFWMMILVVSILVFGSLWIMQNLNLHMTPQQINTYMQNQDSL